MENLQQRHDNVPDIVVGSTYTKVNEKVKRCVVEDKLANTPGIELSDKNGWEKFRDSCGDDWSFSSKVFIYSERWARLMQFEMARGIDLEYVAETTSQDANFDEAVDKFMRSCAVSILSKYWKYGEQLRRWHNIEVQVDDEGEKANRCAGVVLNPAICPVG